MGINATVTITCDNCEEEETFDMEKGESPEDIADRENYQLRGTLLDRILCEGCAEEEEDD